MATTSTTRPRATTEEPTPPLPHQRHGWSAVTPWVLLAGVLAVTAAGLAAVGSLNPAALLVLTAVGYAVVIYTTSRVVEGRRRAKDRLVTAVVTAFFLLALLPLVSVVEKVITAGYARLDGEFFTYSMRGVISVGGGAYHAILGTVIITGVTTVISVPIAIMTAVYLVEYGRGRRLARAITFLVDVMTGIPSIVAGLFAYALFVLFVGPGARAGVIGAVALSVLMIPVVVRSTEEMLRLVPAELREASYALGVPKWRTITKVVLPTSVAGITTGITLAIARVVGETAPLLVTAGATTSTNLNPFSGRMETLPIFSYYSYSAPGIPLEPFLQRAWTAALTLILIVIGLNLIARLISRTFAPRTGN